MVRLLSSLCKSRTFGGVHASDHLYYKKSKRALAIEDLKTFNFLKASGTISEAKKKSRGDSCYL